VSKKSFSPRVCVSRAARIYNMCLARRVFLQLLCVFFIFFIARACAGAYAAARWFSFNLCGLVLSFIARVIDVLPPGVFLEVVWGGFIPGRACVLLPPPKKSRGCPFYGVSAIAALTFSQSPLSSSATLIAWASPDTALSCHEKRF